METEAHTSTPLTKARYIMIGGFLGAGKSTSVSRLAQHLAAEGKRIGLITNDQGSGLVDTALLQSQGFEAEEIAGGCFCCRFNSLVDAANKLTEATAPDVFIAEPVGSCTDLVATVSYPLRRLYGDQFQIAPLSVLLDPVRARRVLGLDHGKRFSDKVVYIYRKQLEEADLLIINKCDLLEDGELDELETALEKAYPNKRRFRISARNGDGLASWYEALDQDAPETAPSMPVDYDLYAEGEALLGWLNATVQLSSESAFDGNQWIKSLSNELHALLEGDQAEIAHLKMTLSPDSGFGDIAAINLVRNDYVPELSQSLPEPVESGQLIINLRAEADPALLHTALTRALENQTRIHPDVRLQLDHEEHFRPGRPEPTHRLTRPTS